IVNRSSALFKRAASVVAYWRERRLVLTNYRTGPAVSADAVAMSVLDFFRQWRSRSQFHSHLPHYTRSSLDRALEQLLEARLLVRKGSPEARDDAKLEHAWSGWLPAAGLLHFSSKNV